jgi:hypothetical protein
MCVVFLGYPMMLAADAAAVLLSSGCPEDVCFQANEILATGRGHDDLRQPGQNIEEIPDRNNYTQYFQ